MTDLFAQLFELPLQDDLKANSVDFVEQLLREEPLIVDKISVRGLQESFVKTLAISEYFTSFCLRKPEFVHYLLDNELITAPVFDVQQVNLVSDDTNQLNAALSDIRTARHLGMMRIIWREFGSIATVQQTLADLSKLADQLIQRAAQVSFSSLRHQFGSPTGAPTADQLCVIAMGKLGGGELNMSSDVDLIFLHGHGGETDVSQSQTGESGPGTAQAVHDKGARSIDHQEFFTKQTKMTVDLLSRMTADGFAYRTDTRLRPFGKSGKVCVSFNSLEHYLSLHGREWERYAYIKQRQVVGSKLQAAETHEILRPFVYRKYLDFGVFDSLRDMQALIAQEITRSELHDNIKRGPGGIRELEFLVQTQQLVYGGKQIALQTPSFYGALDQLRILKIFSEQDAQQIAVDYTYLRRIENGLQGIRDQQTHSLPQNSLDRQRLALLTGHTDCELLDQQLGEVRQRVQQRFEKMSLGPNRSVKNPKTEQAAMLWRSALNPVQSNDVADLATGSLAPLLTLGRGGLRDRMGSIGRQRLDDLMPKIITAIKSLPEVETIVPRLVKFLDGIGRRSAYFALLVENDKVLERVISICQQSPMLAEQLSASPMLLDTLADPRGSSFELTRAGLLERAQRVFSHLDPLDEEQCLLALSEFRLSASFDVAVADIEAQLPVMKISDRLTEIAELILSQALQIATAQMQNRYGVPRFGSPGSSKDAANKASNGGAPEAQFAVVGYGKLGGIELGYGSDLDLVFLYDDGGEGTTDGNGNEEDVIENAQYFSKLARRLIHMLTVPTAFGALFEVDMRLRPSGRSGLLVSRIEAFKKYQQQKAWTWEHQALLRARGIAGAQTLLQRFELIRKQVVSTQRQKSVLQEDVVSMRMRMKKELDKSNHSQFDLKHGDGGLVDLEFLVQYLLLLHGAAHPQIVAYSDNVRQLEALENAELLGEEARDMKAIYLTYRQRLHRLSLSVEKQHELADQYLSERAKVVSLLKTLHLNWFKTPS